MFKTAISKFFTDLKQMTWPQRLDHIWTYYKGVLLTLAFLLFIGVVYAAERSSQPDSLLCGISVNADVTEDGITFLKEGYLSHLGATASGRESSFYQIRFSNEADDAAADYEYIYEQIMKPILMTTAQELDYLLLDHDSMRRYMVYEFYMDLRTVFTEEELKAMGSRVIRTIPQDEQGNAISAEPIPVAIDISTLPFVEEEIRESGAVYLAFAINAPHTDRLRDFWLYLNTYHTPE